MKTTAEYSSFTKAAEELFLTQSTVSSHISVLEKTLGIRLIQRSARQRVCLTREGERVYRDARDILDRCQALQDLKKENQQNQLVIGASSVPGQCLMPEIMEDYLALFPDCHYVQLQGDSIRIHQYLAQGKANLGFVGIAIHLHNGGHVKAVCSPIYVEEFTLERRYLLDDLMQKEYPVQQKEPLSAVEIDLILRLTQELFETPGDLFQSTGCAHSCALVTDGVVRYRTPQRAE